MPVILAPGDTSSPGLVTIRYKRCTACPSQRTCRCSVAQSCSTLCNSMDCSWPGSSVHGVSQARILEWVSISYTRGSSQLRDWTCISCTGRWILYHWTMREIPSENCPSQIELPPLEAMEVTPMANDWLPGAQKAGPLLWGAAISGVQFITHSSSQVPMKLDSS